MTDSELLDRRIEQLVVDTVKRELRKGGIGGAVQAVQGLDTQGLARGIRFDQTSDETLEQHIKVVQETGQTVAGLTESVLLESLRRANARAGEYARELSKLRHEHNDLEQRYEIQGNSHRRFKLASEELKKTCSRLVDERDQAQRYYKEYKERCAELEGANKDLGTELNRVGFELESERSAHDHLRAAYNELAKETA